MPGNGSTYAHWTLSRTHLAPSSCTAEAVCCRSAGVIHQLRSATTPGSAGLAVGESTHAASVSAKKTARKRSGTSGREGLSTPPTSAPPQMPPIPEEGHPNRGRREVPKMPDPVDKLHQGVSRPDVN